MVNNGSILNIVIPMAGAGSRFKNAGYALPKPLINIHNKRMIQWVVENLTPEIPHRFIFICQEEHCITYHLEQYLKKLTSNPIIIPINGITEGAAVTVLKAEEYINDNNPLMIANSDQYIDININDYLKHMQIQRLDGLIMTMKADHPKWSYVGFSEHGQVERVVEKQVISNEATVGIYNFSKGRGFVEAAKKMINDDERSNGEFYVAPIYNRLLINPDYKVGVYNIGEEKKGMYGLGTPEDLDYFLSLKQFIG